MYRQTLSFKYITDKPSQLNTLQDKALSTKYIRDNPSQLKTL